MKSSRGVVDPVTLYLVAGLAVGIFVGSWKPLNMFKKAPPTAQLTELQAKLDAANAEAERARLAREAAVVAERAKLEAQIRAAQQDNVGVVVALKKVPAASQTPEVRLANRMALRVDLKLATAIGRLPDADQQAMIELIEQALSDKQAEIDEANRKLAEADANFKLVTNERNQLKAQIPVLTERVTKAESVAAEVQEKVTQKTAEVKTWADKANTALRESGSLESAIKKALIGLVLIYGAITFIIPGIVKHMAEDNPFKGALRDVAGFISSPLLYSDAKKKLNKKK